jgi:hypothetical protein
MKYSMEVISPCGLKMLEEISSEYRHAKTRMEHHFDCCKELEGHRNEL